MLQIRGEIFETNSSSSCAFVTQIAGYTIPKVIKIDTSIKEEDYDWDGEEMDGPSLEYQSAEKEGRSSDFLAYLGYKGVQKVIVDGKPVDIPEYTGDNYYQSRPYLTWFNGYLFGMYCRFHFAWEDGVPWELERYRGNPDYEVEED